MHVLISDLDEDGAGVGQQVARDFEPISEIAEVGVHAVAPGVAEGLDLLRLARDVLAPAVAHIAAGRRPLEVGVELDSVGRVEVDALHLSAQTLALGQRGHRLQAVAQDHAVRPVRLVSVELGPLGARGQTVEVGEEVLLQTLGHAPLRAPHQVGDQRLRVHLLLDVERRRLHHEVGGVLLVLAAPNKLRIKVAIAALIRDAKRRLILLAHQRLVLHRRDILASGAIVNKRF